MIPVRRTAGCLTTSDVPILPVKELLPSEETETVSTTVRLSKRLRAELTAVAKESGHPLSEVIRSFLRAALELYRLEQRKPPKPPARRR